MLSTRLVIVDKMRLKFIYRRKSTRHITFVNISSVASGVKKKTNPKLC